MARFAEENLADALACRFRPAKHATEVLTRRSEGGGVGVGSGMMWPLVGWVVAVASVALAVTQVVGFGASRILSVAHALTPHLLVLNLPVGVAAVATGHWAVAVLSVPGLAVLAWLSWPLLAPPDQPMPAASPDAVRLFHSNVLFDNEQLDEAAATFLDADADVLVFTEYSPEVADVLLTSPLAGKYPYKLGEPAPYAYGTAIWSRFELTEIPVTEISTENATVVADVHTDHGWVVRVTGVHPPSPLHHFRNWVADLVALRHFEATDTPTVVVGDYNASWWHPLFRHLASGRLRSAHQSVRRGFSGSWRDDVPIPVFVRLDHALVTRDVFVGDVTDIGVPGSDHRSFTVTIRPAV